MADLNVFKRATKYINCVYADSLRRIGYKLQSVCFTILYNARDYFINMNSSPFFIEIFFLFLKHLLHIAFYATIHEICQNT